MFESVKCKTTEWYCIVDDFIIALQVQWYSPYPKGNDVGAVLTQLSAEQIRLLGWKYVGLTLFDFQDLRVAQDRPDLLRMDCRGKSGVTTL